MDGWGVEKLQTVEREKRRWAIVILHVYLKAIDANMMITSEHSCVCSPDHRLTWIVCAYLLIHMCPFQHMQVADTEVHVCQIVCNLLI